MRTNCLSQLLANALIHCPPHRVSHRLARALISASIRKDSQPIKTKFGYSINVGGDTSLSGIRASVILGDFEAGYMRLLASLVKSGETVIDIGANEGYVSLLLAMQVGPNGHVYAIEPHPANVQTLEANIRLNELTNISVIQKAVSDKTGQFEMYGDRAWGTLLRQRNRSFAAISIEVDTIDAMFNDHKSLGQLGLIKIDVEGNEIRVILGAHKLITAVRPIVAFEVNLTLLAYEDISINEMFDFFLDNNYSLFVEHKGRLVPLEWLNKRILNRCALPKERL